MALSLPCRDLGLDWQVGQKWQQSARLAVVGGVNVSSLLPSVPRSDLTEGNMETENAAAAAAAAFTASSQLKEAVLGREPAFSWQCP